VFESVTSELDDEQIDQLLMALRQRMVEARAEMVLIAAPDGSVN
jgi:hypothetical protein